MELAGIEPARHRRLTISIMQLIDFPIDFNPPFWYTFFSQFGKELDVILRFTTHAGVTSRWDARPRQWSMALQKKMMLL